MERNRRIHGDGWRRNRQNPWIIDETHHQKRHCIRAGPFVDDIRHYGTLPAHATEITDAGFLQQVEANDSYQSVDVESKKAGLDATLALSERMRVLRVPAGAVFGINGSTGCIVPTSNNHGNTPVKVSIVGGELGVSLVQADSKDIASISNVEIGSGLNNLTCE